MGDWKFTTADGWQPLAPGDVPPWPDGMTWENRLKALGFSSCGMGLETEFVTDHEVYRGSGRWAWLVSVGDMDGTDLVFVDSLPSMLRVLRELEPLWRMQTGRHYIEHITSIIQKAFEAWHGHSSHTECHSCDRAEAEAKAQRRRDRVRAREEKKAATKNGAP